MLDMTLDILVENEKIGLTSIWHYVGFVTQPKNNKISTSADISIEHQFNIDIRWKIYIELWSTDVATEI